MPRPAHNPQRTIDLREPRPKTRGDALRLIAETFSYNDWGEREVLCFLSSIGLEGDWRSFGNNDLKVIIDDMERFRMILFRDDVST